MRRTNCQVRRNEQKFRNVYVHRKCRKAKKIIGRLQSNGPNRNTFQRTNNNKEYLRYKIQIFGQLNKCHTVFKLN
jgi:hypothetical protein